MTLFCNRKDLVKPRTRICGGLLSSLPGLFLSFLFLLPQIGAAKDTALGAPLWDCRIVRTFPHDPESFTQGLVFDNGALYEGTGLHGRSYLQRIDLKTGTPVQRTALAPEHFGEGIALAGSRIVQLTWKSRLGFVYDRQSFSLLQTFSYDHEGWGITFDGRRLWISDGTEILRLVDPVSFRQERTLRVYDAQGSVRGLNELEMVGGDLYANLWPTSRIAVISPKTGRIKAYVDCANLLTPAEEVGADVLNGIAYDARRGRLYVTGKYWPKLFEIRVVPRKRSIAP